MEALGQAKFRVIYNSKDISRDLVANLLSIKYTDNTEDKADELSLTLENVDAYWENEWYPQKGDKIECEIGYEALMNCGQFEVDEIEIASSPDTVTIKAIAAAVTGSLRTVKSKAHENTTLKEIVDQVAGAHGLTVTGEIGDIQFTRITQHRERDLAFLHRLAKQFGYYFSIRGDKLVFASLYSVATAGAVRDIDRTDCLSYSIKDQSAKVVRKMTVSHHNTDEKDLESLGYNPEVALSDAGIDVNEIEGMEMEMPVTGDDAELLDRIENDGQADAMAKAAMIENNTNQQEGSLSLIGDPSLVAGNNFTWTGIGKLSGKYHIVTSDHEISKGGYTTSLQVKRVGFIDLVKGKRKQSGATKGYRVIK